MLKPTVAAILDFHFFVDHCLFFLVLSVLQFDYPSGIFKLFFQAKFFFKVVHLIQREIDF
jgi:hypothetical protein